jgi:hypothetical protein
MSCSRKPARTPGYGTDAVRAEPLAHQRPYPLPPLGRPLRVAFVGQATYFKACALHAPAGGLEPLFVDFRGGENTGELDAALRSFRPHAVVAFRPELLPRELFATLRVPVVGVAPDPLPRPGEGRYEGAEWSLQQLAGADPATIDRLIVCDAPAAASVPSELPLWRSLPLPVDDRLYRPLRAPGPSPRVVFIGHSTMHRESYLLPLKHTFDIGHYAHALMDEQLEAVLDEADVGLVLHSDLWPQAFEHMLLIHLAAGHLVISEPQSPTYGLEPNIDYVEIVDDDPFHQRVHQVHQNPTVFDRVRVRGRAKAEGFRASVVWPALIADLFDDLAAFGTHRSFS